MIVGALKSFYKNGKFAFMVAGIFYFAVILAVFFLINGLFAICGDNIKLMIQKISVVIAEYAATFSVEAVRQIPTVWQQILQTVQQYTAEFTTQLFALFVALLFLLVLAGAIAKSFAVVYMRKETIKSNLLFTLLGVAIRAILSLAFLLFALYLTSLWPYVIFLLLLLYVPANTFFTVVFAKLNRQLKGISLRKLLRPSTYLTVTLAYFAACVVLAVVAAVLVLSLNLFVAALTVIPLAIYLFACVEAHSAAYLTSGANDKAASLKLDAQSERQEDKKKQTVLEN